MRKIFPIAIVMVAILVLPPILADTPNADINYTVNLIYVQVSPDRVAPNGIPLCRITISGSPSNIVCYSPNFIRKAYNVPSTLTGSGQTILIVEAFGSPTIRHDLAVFDNRFGIPAPRSFRIICPTGCPTFNPRNPHGEVGWSIETSLDVEYAHAMAPGANIVLVVASTSSGNAINAAETAAIAAYPGSIMSQSFGIPEIVVRGNAGQLMQAHRNYVAAAAAGITVLAPAGDGGATNGFSRLNALFPASDPLVTAVGGTQGLPYNATGTLQPCPASTTCTSGLVTFTGSPGSPCNLGRTVPPPCIPVGYGGEQVWNEPSFGAATGGAPSLFFGVPSYQSGLGLNSRTTPDVSFDAAIDGGVLVDWSAISPALLVVGGTSVGPPQWAGIFALVNHARATIGKGPIGFANPTIYGLTAARKMSDFHDITVGNNKLGGTLPGFTSGSGWDAASGWGTPNVANLVTDLANS